MTTSSRRSVCNAAPLASAGSRDTDSDAASTQGQLINLDDVATAPSAKNTKPPTSEAAQPRGRVVRVLPDVPAINKLFDYVVPEGWDDVQTALIDLGTMVRVALHGRRVNGWIVGLDVDPPTGVRLSPLLKVRSIGPSADMIELAEWAAWRWAGRVQPLLGTASPVKMVRGLPSPTDRPTVAAQPMVSGLAKVFDKDVSVVRLPPATDVYPVVFEATQRGNALIVAGSHRQSRLLGVRLRRAGVSVALMPDEWAKARSGATVIGPRSAAFAPVVDLAAVVVLDEHDEGHQEERTPTWNARDVAVERAARAGIPVALVSPIPSLEALALAPVLKPSRAAERRGWPVVDVLDRHQDDPIKGGLLSDALVDVLRAEGRVVCVLNRKGRSKRLACASCGELAWHEQCSVALVQLDDMSLSCPSCGLSRPVVCAKCGAGRFKNLRAGVTRLREEIEALALRPAIEVSGDQKLAPSLPAPGQAEPIYIGTEAALHRIDEANAVAFLDFDQELLAPRYRASEQALALLARAARLVGDREGGGRLVVQTRMPTHPVIDAAVHADPSRMIEAERANREVLGWPPFRAMAEVSGANAAAVVDQLRLADVELLGPNDNKWLVRASSSADLANALAAVERPGGRVRIAVDPLRV